METELAYFDRLRTTYCKCVKCQHIYRLSDGELYSDVRQKLGWLDKLEREIAKIEIQEKALKDKIAKAKADATLQGRLDAATHIEQFDTIFAPLGLNPCDAKVHFHPVDFIVFNGLNAGQMKNIVLLDKKENEGPLQNSIRNCVEQEHYSFMTIKIQNDGSIVEE